MEFELLPTTTTTTVCYERRTSQSASLFSCHKSDYCIQLSPPRNNQEKANSIMSTNAVQTPVPGLWAVAIVWMTMVMTMQADLASAAVTDRLPDCDGCHCAPAQGTNGTCPALPTLPNTAELRAFELLNPMTINCNPMNGGLACMKEFDGSNITTGEACVVELVAPAPTSVCPANFSYRYVLFVCVCVCVCVCVLACVFVMFTLL